MKKVFALLGLVAGGLGCSPAVLDPIDSTGGGGGPVGPHPSHIGTTDSCKTIGVLEPFMAVAPVKGLLPGLLVEAGPSGPASLVWSSQFTASRIDTSTWPPALSPPTTLLTPPTNEFAKFAAAPRGDGTFALAVIEGPPTNRVIFTEHATTDGAPTFTDWAIAAPSAKSSPNVVVASGAGQLLLGAWSELARPDENGVIAADQQAVGPCQFTSPLAAVATPGGFLAAVSNGFSACTDEHHPWRTALVSIPRDGALAPVAGTSELPSAVHGIRLLPRGDGAWLVIGADDARIRAYRVDSLGTVEGDALVLARNVLDDFDVAATKDGGLLLLWREYLGGASHTSNIHMIQLDTNGQTIASTDLPYAVPEGANDAPDYGTVTVVRVGFDYLVVHGIPGQLDEAAFVAARLGCTD
jgi:hypothetical protein